MPQLWFDVLRRLGDGGMKAGRGGEGRGGAVASEEEGRGEEGRAGVDRRIAQFLVFYFLFLGALFYTRWVWCVFQCNARCACSNSTVSRVYAQRAGRGLLE